MGRRPAIRRAALEQVATVWNALPPKRRAIVAAAGLAMFLAVLTLARLATAPGMGLLYGGLEAGAAGEVVQALDQRGIRYEVRGDSIWVDGRVRDETRMSLAAQGLPANNAAGYELLEGLSGFGTTAQMFDAAYWRAKEGELARTIVASPHIRAARVHIAHSRAQGFRREERASAAVTVTTTGSGLTAAQARALRFLVASSVAGLRAEDVSVIDGSNGLVAGPEDEAEAALHGGERAAQLRRNVERLLEAHVGHGRAVVEVSVETVTERESLTERRFDPEGRVAVSTETEERTNTSADNRDIGVTVASNLPTGAADATAGAASSQGTETRERVNYEVSEVQRELLRMPGAIRRVSVAVMVDGRHGTDANGAATWEPRTEAELEALRELVASAVGFDAARGDVITLRSLPFEPVMAQGTAAETRLFAPLQLDPVALLRMVALALVALVLGLFVLRPILAARPAPVPAGTAPRQLAPPATAVTNTAAQPASGALTGEITDDSPLAIAPGTQERAQKAADDTEDPVARLRRLIDARQDETAAILRGWVEEQEEPR